METKIDLRCKTCGFRCERAKVMLAHMVDVHKMPTRKAFSVVGWAIREARKLESQVLRLVERMGGKQAA